MSGIGFRPSAAQAPAAAGQVHARQSARRRALGVAAVVAGSLGVTVAILLLQRQIRALSALGYPGVFLVSLLSNATVILPAPGLAFTFAMGGVLNPLAVGLLAGLGETLGEFTGYLAGRAGRAALSGSARNERIEAFTRRYGGLAVFVLAAVPAALFDVVGLAAGAMRMPVGRFLLCTWAGKTLKTLFVAFAGLYSLGWVSRLLG